MTQQNFPWKIRTRSQARFLGFIDAASNKQSDSEIDVFVGRLSEGVGQL
jgi:hypothetical protein